MALKNKRTTKFSSRTTGRKTKTRTKTPSMQLKAITEKQTKGQIIKTIAEQTGLTLGQVKSVFTAAGHIVKCHLIKRGSGEFAIPEMAIKVVRKTKPATKKRLGRNPMTGETITIAAKPKREVIKIRPLKTLKDLLAHA